MARRSARKAAQVVLVARPSPPDAAGARQRQTLRAGSIWLKSFGFRLGRGATTTFTETLDLEPNGLRQSDPVFTGNALGVEPQQVVPGLAQATDWRLEVYAAVRAMPIVSVQPDGQLRSALV